MPNGRAASLPKPPWRQNARLTYQMLSRPTVALDTIADAYGGMCALGWGPVRMAIIGTDDGIREVLANSADTYVWGHRFQRLGPASFVGRRSMLASDGADHTRRRGAVQSAFTRQRINGWSSMIVERADATIDEILASARPDRPIDLYPFGRRLILGITLRALFGDRWSMRLDDVHDRVLRAQRFIEAPAIRQLPVPLPVGLRAAVRRDRRVLDEMIDADLALVRARPPGEVDGLLGILAFAEDVTDEEIRDQVVTLIGAGFDTTASTLAWLVSCVARSPDVLGAMRAEADGVRDDWTAAALPFAGRVVHEVLRLHPAGPMAVREAAREVRISGHTIGKGTMIGWSPYLSGRDPRVWPDPLRFDPDRGLRLDDAQRADTERAWIPFGRGPHMCIGFALAQLELTLIAARLAHRCDIAAATDDMPTPVGLVVSRPSGGAIVTVEPRPAR